MSLRAAPRSRVADRALAPAHSSILKPVPGAVTEPDLGCGTGDRLSRAAPRLCRRGGHPIGREAATPLGGIRLWVFVDGP